MSTSNITSPPPPRDNLSVDPLDCPPLRWGILGCGRVSNDFVQALKNVASAQVVACAARSEASALEFSKKFNISKGYGSYEQLVADESVDIVYVGNVHAFRRKIGEMCLNANKHVLLEKPFACKEKDAEFLVNLARSKKLFCMEGMWTRFFPAVEYARRLVMEEKIIGEVVSVTSDFNFNASDSEAYPESFVYTHSVGGGSTLLVAPYPITAATLFFDGSMPESVKCVGQVDSHTGVDLQAACILSFAQTSDLSPALDDENENENTPKLPGSGVASLSFGLLGESVEETIILGTKGRVVIHSPGHCPTKISVAIKAYGRGETTESKVYEFPLPGEDEGYFYPNSAGFAYEAAAVSRCIAAGMYEVPQYSLDETLTTARILDEIRKQLGVKDFDA